MNDILRKSAANESNSYWSESKCLLLSRFPFGVVDSNPTPPAMPWNWRVDCFLDQLPFLNLATFIMHPAHVSYFKCNHLVSEDCITFLIIKLSWALFVTYTIIQSITSSEMCSLHLTHSSAHTPGAVGSRRCSARGAVGVPCLAQGSHLIRGQFLPEPRFEPTTWVTSATLYPFSKIPIFIIQTFMQINCLSQYINKCFCLFVYELQLGVHYLRVKIVRVRVRLGLGLIVIIFW